MTPFQPHPEVNPGWVSNTIENTTEESIVPAVENNAPAQLAIQQGFETEAPVLTEAAIADDELQLLKRLGYAYQTLASSIVKAKQAQQELRNKLAIYKTAIEERQQELQQIIVQLVEQQTHPSAVPANETESAEAFAQLKDLIKGSHHASLLNKLHQMQAAVDNNQQHLPEILSALRSELDLVILQASRLTALERLNEAYKKYRQFQEYNSRSEQEFQSLMRTFAQA